MKPCLRILFHSRNSAFFGFPSPKCHHSLTGGIPPASRLNFDIIPKFHSNSPRSLGLRDPVDGTPKQSSPPNSSCGQSRVFSITYNGGGIGRGVYVIAGVSSNVWNYSTSVETRVNGKNFERIYVQGGINVKPLVVERINKDENIARDEEVGVKNDVATVNTENSEGIGEVEVSSASKEESEDEREAWKLLQHAVVTYCGSPIGTVAANDPADKQPLNYDQVFIRDFAPSALAFLLGGKQRL